MTSEPQPTYCSNNKQNCCWSATWRSYRQNALLTHIKSECLSQFNVWWLIFCFAGHLLTLVHLRDVRNASWRCASLCFMMCGEGGAGWRGNKCGLICCRVDATGGLSMIFLQQRRCFHILSQHVWCHSCPFGAHWFKTTLNSFTAQGAMWQWPWWARPCSSTKNSLLLWILNSQWTNITFCFSCIWRGADIWRHGQHRCAPFDPKHLFFNFRVMRTKLSEIQNHLKLWKEKKFPLSKHV